MNTQEQIDACEQELGSLLSRVLEGTLKPIREGLESLKQQQSDLKCQVVEQLNSTSDMVSDELGKVEMRLNRLKSERDDAQLETVTLVTALMTESQASLLNAQTDAHASLGERLAGHTIERTSWLAQSLESLVTQGTLQQQQSADDLRTNLLHRLTALESGSEALEQIVAGFAQRLEQLDQSLLKLQQDGQAMQNTTTRGQRELKVLYEVSSQRAEALIDKVLRPIRYLLTAALVVAIGGTLLAAYGQWGTILR